MRLIERVLDWLGDHLDGFAALALALMALAILLVVADVVLFGGRPQ